MESEKANKTNKLLIVVVVVAIVAGGYFLYKSSGGGDKFKIAFPFTQDISGRTSLACEALIDSGITGSPEEHLTNGIEATLGKGTNKVSLQIKDEETLLFLSGASFEAGDVSGVDFSIIKNDGKELVAARWDGNSMNSIVVNKKNGLAIWSKIRPDFFTYDAPTASLSYLICR